MTLVFRSQGTLDLLKFHSKQKQNMDKVYDFEDQKLQMQMQMQIFYAIVSSSSYNQRQHFGGDDDRNAGGGFYHLEANARRTLST